MNVTYCTILFYDDLVSLQLEEEMAQKVSESASKLAPVMESQEPEDDASKSKPEAQQEEATPAAPEQAATEETTEPPVPAPEPEPAADEVFILAF